MNKPLAALPLADIIDMIARLKAAETVLELLCMQGLLQLEDEATVLGIRRGRTCLQAEAMTRFQRMKELHP